ncbi:MAG: SelT/SelW/SelH family protein [Polaribacter sp.]|nr:SelT/SelW/SelH family protein [Polaribacter sp.]
METKIIIKYCPKCRWLLRSSWMAQELLTTFEIEISELTLKPAAAGIFKIYVNKRLIWCRKENGGFPDIKELKQLVRDEIAPNKHLGHSDKN